MWSTRYPEGLHRLLMFQIKFHGFSPNKLPKSVTAITTSLCSVFCFSHFLFLTLTGESVHVYAHTWFEHKNIINIFKKSLPVLLRDLLWLSADTHVTLLQDITIIHSCIQQRLYSPLLGPGRFFSLVILYTPITVAARSKAWNVSVRSNTGIVGSNPIQGMDVCISLLCVCPRCPADCLKLGNWSETKRFMDALCSKWEQ
jgi:hypothetical protein